MSNPAQATGLFQPTRYRLLAAGLVALGSFLLPQEAPLEWYPLNEPGPDGYQLEITCGSNVKSEIRLYYATTGWFTESESIHIAVAPTGLPYTYTFPLPDSPVTALRLDPVARGGTLHLRQLRVINRAGEEIHRFTRQDFFPAAGIKEIAPFPDGWSIASQPNARNPQTLIALKQPIVPEGMNHRNLLRCLYSAGYLAVILWILLLTLAVVIRRPISRRALGGTVWFMAVLALLFALVGNRGLIRQSFRAAAFPRPEVPPGIFLEVDLTSSGPAYTQLYWDVGRGPVEADSSRLALESHRGLQTIRFPLPWENIQSLRYDPRDNEGHLSITGFRLTDNAGRTLARIPLNSLQAVQEIARLTTSQDSTQVHTVPKSRDSITYFRPEALATINRVKATQP